MVPIIHSISACLVSSLRRPRLEETLGTRPGPKWTEWRFHGEWTQEEEENLKTLGFNPPEYSNSLLKRFFVRSDQHEAKIKPEKSPAKTGGRCRHFRASKIACEFLFIQYKSKPG